jgi:hypothetical protein
MRTFTVVQGQRIRGGPLFALCPVCQTPNNAKANRESTCRKCGERFIVKDAPQSVETR